jgi:enamine deaminase RidA (YjgF/YER057c/UK114 family)
VIVPARRSPPNLLTGTQEEAMTIKRHGVGKILSQIVEDGDTIYLQGFTADDKSADMKGQTQQVLAKIDKALAAAGSDKSHLLSAQIFVSDIGLRPQMNEVWTAWMDPQNPPTRACVGVQLEGNTLVEIIIVAKKK